MQEQLEIVILQSDLVWENPIKNKENFNKKIRNITKKVDLIILPEMFTTGFTINAEKSAESMNGSTVKWMLDLADEKNALLMGSIVIKEKDNFYNRFIIAFPNGGLKYYDKRHLFSYAKEDKVYTAGKNKLIFEYKGFKICPLICYDLRFPVWSRNTEEVDLIIYIANWPNARIMAWDTLLKARAIENLCYVVGLNRVGVDKNNLIYVGHSAAYNALGETISNCKPNTEDIGSISLDKNYITETRSKFRFLDDGDEFEIL